MKQALKINLLTTFESALIKELKAARRDHWLTENKEAIAACNKLTEPSLFLKRAF